MRLVAAILLSLLLIVILVAGVSLGVAFLASHPEFVSWWMPGDPPPR